MEKSRVVVALLAVGLGCSSAGGGERDGAGSGARGQGATGSGSGATNGTGGSITLCESGDCIEPDAPAPANCGDGALTKDEDCDDGNRLDGDGCGSACRNIVVK